MLNRARKITVHLRRPSDYNELGSRIGGFAISMSVGGVLFIERGFLQQPWESREPSRGYKLWIFPESLEAT